MCKLLKKGFVFTRCWLCNEGPSLIDRVWFDNGVLLIELVLCKECLIKEIQKWIWK